MPSKIDDNEMKALVQANKHSTVRELATALKVSVGSVHGHLKSLGFVKKLDVWVLHELKEIHMTNRMSICDQLKREENDPFLKHMMTATKNGLFTTMSIEKEVKVGEMKSQAKAEIHQKMVMVSMWWNQSSMKETSLL